MAISHPSLPPKLLRVVYQMSPNLLMVAILHKNLAWYLLWALEHSKGFDGTAEPLILPVLSVSGRWWGLEICSSMFIQVLCLSLTL